ncbi:MAG: hypothetical protein R3C26_18605 [Calditrichia bacterium]
MGCDGSRITHAGWRDWVGEKGIIIGIDTFAPAHHTKIYKHYGLIAENVWKSQSFDWLN